MALLPSFHEVPGPLSGSDGLVLNGFPAEVLAEFRLYSLVNQALMWLAIGVTWAYLAVLPRMSRRTFSRLGSANPKSQRELWTPAANSPCDPAPRHWTNVPPDVASCPSRAGCWGSGGIRRIGASLRVPERAIGLESGDRTKVFGDLVDDQPTLIGRGGGHFASPI
jgi:hypothetical protein